MIRLRGLPSADHRREKVSSIQGGPPRFFRSGSRNPGGDVVLHFSEADGNSVKWDGRAVPHPEDARPYRTHIASTIETIDGVLDSLHRWKRVFAGKLSRREKLLTLRQSMRIWRESDKACLEDLAVACSIRGIDPHPIYRVLSKLSRMNLMDAEATILELQARTAMEIAEHSQSFEAAESYRYMILPVSCNDAHNPIRLTRGMVGALVEFFRALKRTCDGRTNSVGAHNLSMALNRFALLGDQFSNRSHPYRLRLRCLHSSPPSYLGRTVSSFSEAAWDVAFDVQMKARKIISKLPKRQSDADVWRRPWSDDKFAARESMFEETWLQLCESWREKDDFDGVSLMAGVRWEQAQLSEFDGSEHACADASTPHATDGKTDNSAGDGDGLRAESIDDSAYAPASSLWQHRFDTYRKFQTWLKNTSESDVRRRKPSRNRLEVHAGDWARHWNEIDRRQFDSLDRDFK